MILGGGGRGLTDEERGESEGGRLFGGFFIKVEVGLYGC